ncbi:MAG: hypothetical protein V6Z81_01835 [Parvularculales bacterium]
MELSDHISQGPQWIQFWVTWLAFINTAAVLFAFHRKEAHWILTAWLAVLVFMPVLFDEVGYVRLLGIVHIIFWTPLLVYLWRQRSQILWKTLSGFYIRVLFISNLVSLTFDYVDLIRYIAGDYAA